MDISDKLTIPYNELLKKLQNLLQCPECRNIHIDSIEVYSEQTDGANWDVTNFRCSGHDHDLVECREKISEQVKNFRLTYDVVK